MAGNWRVAIAFAFIGAMVVALVLLLLPDEDNPVAAGTPLPSTTTTTSSPTTTTSTTIAETTTTSVQPGDRLAEVERILEELNIAWYDAVYRKDESGLADVVATASYYESAVSVMDTADFLAAPSDATIRVQAHSILLDRPDCLVVHYQLDVSALLPEAPPSDAVQVLWPTPSGMYRLVSRWSSPNDFWDDDCDALNRDEIP